MGSVWNGVARQVSGSFFLSWVGVGLCLCGDVRMRLVGGWVFVMVRLLLLYIVINTGKWDLTVFKMGCVGGIFV